MSFTITPETKVAELIETYPEAEDVLIGLAAPFKALKNPVLRRTVARVATLEQAARVGGLPVRDLVQALRTALGVDAGADGEETAGSGESDRESPVWIEEAEPASDLDAEAVLAAGDTPVAQAMALLGELPQGQVLLITASFQPAPLIDAMRGKGHEVHARKKGPDAWEVWVRKA